MFVRLVGFFNLSMVLPTIEQYILSTGGTQHDYFVALAWTIGLGLVFTIGFAWYVDITDRMLTTYIITQVFLIAGNALYAVANIMPSIRHPTTIIVSRAMVGIGSANAFIGLAYFGRTLLPEERQPWAALSVMMRTAGLLVGPAITVALQLMFGSGDEQRSVFDIYAAPATFLFIFNVVGTIWLVCSWKFPPAPVPNERKSRVGLEEKSMCVFMSQPKVFVLIISFALAMFLIFSVEVLVPPVTTNLLRWTTGKGGGGVLSAIGIATLISQFSTVAAKDAIQPPRMLLLGLCAMTFMALCSLGTWCALFGTQMPTLTADAEPHWFVVTAPFVLLEICAPWISIPTMTLWMDAVVEQVPLKASVMQATFMNLAILGGIAATAWDAWSYSDEKMQAEGLPWLTMAGIAAVGGIGALSIRALYSQ